MVVRQDNPAVKSPRRQYRFLVSACLAGVNCKYNGKNNLRTGIKKLVDDKRAIALCPEIMGGLSVPREGCEISGGDGRDVLEGRARVITPSGGDLSVNIIRGSKKVLSLVKRYKISRAILKSKSPSCGRGGVLSALLHKNGIKIRSL